MAQLVASQRRDMIEWDGDMVDALYQFSDNGNSRAHCITSQPLGAAVAAARAEVVEREKAPEVVYELDEKFRRWENPYESVAPDPPTGRAEVALFVGDEATHLHPSTLEAALSLLDDIGVDPVLVGRGRNNGFLASSLGLREQARDLARATLSEVEEHGATTLVVLSPGDYFAFGQMYEERLGVPLPEAVDLVELTQLLAREWDGAVDSLNGEDGSYAYVDPTHAVRVPSHFGPARRLAETVFAGQSRVKLFRREERAYPSGNLALQFTHPGLADRLTKSRLEDAREAAARQVTTVDAGSLYHLKQHASSFDVAVEGLLEAAAERA
ncbi:MAG: hypothetical protein V5A48_04065 [Salinivenus sp.]